MKIQADRMEFVLAADQPLRLAGARGRRILCTGGRAWITAPGHLDDVILAAGEAWEVSSDGLVLVEGLGRATVRL